MKKNELFICVDKIGCFSNIFSVIVFSKNSMARYKIAVKASETVYNDDDFKENLLKHIVSNYEKYVGYHSSTKFITTDSDVYDILKEELSDETNVLYASLSSDTVSNFIKYDIDDYVDDCDAIHTFKNLTTMKNGGVLSTKKFLPDFEESVIRLISAIDEISNIDNSNLASQPKKNDYNVIPILEKDLENLTNKLLSEKVQNDTKAHLDTLRLIKDCVALIEQVKSEGKIQKVEMTNVDEVVKRTKDSLVMELKKIKLDTTTDKKEVISNELNGLQEFRDSTHVFSETVQSNFRNYNKWIDDFEKSISSRSKNVIEIDENDLDLKGTGKTSAILSLSYKYGLVRVMGNTITIPFLSSGTYYMYEYKIDEGANIPINLNNEIVLIDVSVDNDLYNKLIEKNCIPIGFIKKKKTEFDFF